MSRLSDRPIGSCCAPSREGRAPNVALVNHYMNAWSPLPWMTRDGIDVGTADYRVITPVSVDDPDPERGITDPPATTFVRPSEGSVEVDVTCQQRP